MAKVTKENLVEEMFDNIASTYDTLNHRLSWDIDKGWRKRAIQQLKPFRPERYLTLQLVQVTLLYLLRKN